MLSSNLVCPLLRNAWLILHYSQAQKLLFSATLTRDPARIAALNLYKPVYIAVVSKSAEGDNNPEQTASTLLESDRNFALPETLTVSSYFAQTKRSTCLNNAILPTGKDDRHAYIGQSSHFPLSTVYTQAAQYPLFHKISRIGS